MTDLARLSDAELLDLYRAESAVFEWCWEEAFRVLARVNPARKEIQRRGLGSGKLRTLYCCRSCGEVFAEPCTDHATHAPGCDGSCRDCPTQCGPVLAETWNDVSQAQGAVCESAQVRVSPSPTAEEDMPF